MREQFDPDLDAIADAEDTAEFKRNRRRELPAGCPDREIRDEPC